MKKSWTTFHLFAVTTIIVSGCATTSPKTEAKIDSIMKAYKYDSSSAIGKTNPTDDAKINGKNVIYPTSNIPGLNVQTVVLNMQRIWGIKPVNAGFEVSWYTYRGERSAGDISEGYAEHWRSPHKVDVVDFSLVTKKNATNVSKSKLKSAAIQYLGFGATLPYTGANPQAAKNWVVNELKTYHGTGTVGHKIGTVYFMLDPYEKLSDNQMISELTIATSTMGTPSSDFK